MLTAIEGIGVTTALAVWTEVGPDLDAFKTEKHFCPWLGLCPDNRISGGRVLSRRTRKVINRLIYRPIKHGEAYVHWGLAAYEASFRERKLPALRKAASNPGFNLIAQQQLGTPVS